jgi:transposase
MEALSTPPNLMPDHQLGFEIRTKHKEAIRHLHSLANWGASALAKVYKTGRSTIIRILQYNAPERARPTRTGRPRFLNHQQVLDIIEYISSSWEGRCLNYVQLRTELGIEASARTIKRRLKEAGYY